MTIQSKDVLRLREKVYTLLGRGGGPLFDPNDVGIKSGWNMSTNWRGFTATFAISNNCLVLDGLRVNASPSMATVGNVQLLFGKLPEVSSLSDQMRAAGFEQFAAAFTDSFVLEYTALAASMSYEGGLLLANGWINSDRTLDRYQHSACNYEDVLEIVLADGQLVQELDHSLAISAVRAKMLKMDDGEQIKQRSRIREEIEACFSQKYDYRY